MGTFCSKKRRRPTDSPPQIISHSQTAGPFQNANKMYSPFRGLRRGHSTSAGSLLVLPQSSSSSSNFSYPYPRTHHTLVVPASAIQQRDRPPLDSPTSATSSSTFGQSQPFRRPPLNRAIPPIPESRSNESIISQASQLTHRHSISGTSASISIKESARAAPKTVDNSVVIENRMAKNLGARYATNIPVTTTIQTTTVAVQPSTSGGQQPTTTVTTKKTVAIITTRKVEEPSIPPSKKPTRLPLPNKKVRTSRDVEPKSPLLSMARSVRSRLNKLGTRIGRATSRSPIRSSKSMVSMRRDTSNLDKSAVDSRLSKSTSEQPVARFEPPPPPSTSPPHEDDLEKQPTGRVSLNSQRSVSQIPRRYPATTLIPSPGIYFRRLPEDERVTIENEGPILTIDSKEALATPDENKPPAPILMLRKASGELKETPLENAPPPLNKRANFRRHKHSHSFGGDSSAQVRTPKLTARLIVRQPSEPLYYQQTHRRSKSRDAIIEMQTPRVVKKREKPTEGEESVKTTRSLKIVTYSAPEPSEEKKSPKPAKKGHKKSSSVDISTVCAASQKYSTSSATGNSQGKRGATALCTSASASKADEMRLYKGSLIPRRFEPRSVKWVNKNKRAPLAIAEQSRVANSPAVELPPNGFEDADLKVRQSRLVSPARTRRMLFWRSKSKSTSDRGNEPTQNDRNNNSKSVDQAEEYRTVTTMHITTKPPPPSPPATDNNGNTVEKTPKTERETRLGRLTLNELIASPLNARKRNANNKIQQAKQRSGLIDDEIEDQPLLISTELGLIDEQTPHQTYLSRDLNENFDAMADQRTVRVQNDQPAHHYVASSVQQRTTQNATAQSPPKIAPHEHAAIEKIIEDLSSQLSRIKEYAIEDEDEMKKLRVENDSLKEELQIKDQVIQLLMSRLKDPGAQTEATAQK